MLTFTHEISFLKSKLDKGYLEQPTIYDFLKTVKISVTYLDVQQNPAIAHCN